MPNAELQEGNLVTASFSVRHATVDQVALPIIVGLYLFVFLIPIEFSFYIGQLLITPTRLFLLVLAGPVIFSSITNHKLQSEDVFFIIFISWVSVAYFYKRGAAGIEIIGQTFLEVAISYCVARTYLVTFAQFIRLALILSVTVAILGILAIPEGISHYRYLHELPQKLTGFDYYISDDTRVGLLRSASTFEHPILFGMFCASLFSLAWYSLSSLGARLSHAAFTLMATLLALSSAALLLLIMQFLLVGIEKITRPIKRRTMIFGTLLISFVVLIEAVSNRGIIKLIGGTLTFNPHTAYYRLLQWDYSIDDVRRHPFVGINFENWTRPFWMTDSIDNHWLFLAMNSGIPAVFALWIVMGIISVKLYQKKQRTADIGYQKLYMGWLIGTASLFLGAWTVTLFGKMLPVFMFFLGIGAAMTRLPEEDPSQTEEKALPEALDPKRSSFTRFASEWKQGVRQNTGTPNAVAHTRNLHSSYSHAPHVLSYTNTSEPKSTTLPKDRRASPKARELGSGPKFSRDPFDQKPTKT